MGTRTSYEPGAFCWVDLSTPDVEGAKAFYSALLGWEIEDRPGPHGTYSMANVGGEPVAAVLPQATWEAETDETGCADFVPVPLDDLDSLRVEITPLNSAEY